MIVDGGHLMKIVKYISAAVWPTFTKFGSDRLGLLSAFVFKILHSKSNTVNGRQFENR